MPNFNEKIKEEWKVFTETVEADFIQDGFHGHDQVLSFLSEKLSEARTSAIKECLDYIGHFKAKTDESSQDLDTVYLHLKSKLEKLLDKKEKI